MPKKYLWLSHLLTEQTPAYGGGQGLNILTAKSISGGDTCNTATWHLPSHIGTHVDAPKHFFDHGKTIDQFGPEFWIFNRVCIIPVKLDTTSMLIGPEHVVPFIKSEPDLILIKTGMHRYRQQGTYWEDNPGLSPALGRELRTCCPALRAIGVDFISISSWRNRVIGREAHRVFLNPDTAGAQIVLIEDMDFSLIDENTSVGKIIVMPVRVKNGDGAPCTVIAEVEIND
jgi:kynurenine formamidase